MGECSKEGSVTALLVNGNCTSLSVGRIWLFGDLLLNALGNRSYMMCSFP